MIFSLLITAAPSQSQGATTALRFAQAVLDARHSIHCVFFYHDGIKNASTFSIYPQDETNIPTAWQTFCSEKNIHAIVCISAANKRGLINERDSQRHTATGFNVSPTMEIGGLGLLTEAIMLSDRVVTFG
jgi:tRNA 2-thiouridine synthesizing protein D